jgi:hypothetical protein
VNSKTELPGNLRLNRGQTRDGLALGPRQRRRAGETGSPTGNIKKEIRIVALLTGNAAGFADMAGMDDFKG